jgi:hypothetical protein
MQAINNNVIGRLFEILWWTNLLRDRRSKVGLAAHAPTNDVLQQSHLFLKVIGLKNSLNVRLDINE